LTPSLWEVCLGANTTCTIFGGKFNRVYAPTGWLGSSVRIGPVFAEASETGDFWRRLGIRAAKHSVSCDHPESLREFSEKKYIEIDKCWEITFGGAVTFPF